MTDTQRKLIHIAITMAQRLAEIAEDAEDKESLAITSYIESTLSAALEA